jgi:uncharacterized membrane protein
MTESLSGKDAGVRKDDALETEARLAARLHQLTAGDGAAPHRFGARLRNYFVTGLIIVGPVTITIYIVWWFMNVADAWFKPLVPSAYLPETYLPFAVPGIGLLFGIVLLTVIGALAANLLGRSLVSFGELMLDRMPIVRNVYRALKQIFESAIATIGPAQGFEKVGLIEFPSKGLWSLVFVTGETKGEISLTKPGGEEELVTVFMPTGIVPPTGFICFVPKRDVTFLKMSIEDAAKIVISAGMVVPDYEARLKQLAAKSAKAPKSLAHALRTAEPASNTRPPENARPADAVTPPGKDAPPRRTRRDKGARAAPPRAE